MKNVQSWETYHFETHPTQPNCGNFECLEADVQSRCHSVPIVSAFAVGKGPIMKENTNNQSWCREVLRYLRFKTLQNQYILLCNFLLLIPPRSFFNILLSLAMASTSMPMSSLCNPTRAVNVTWFWLVHKSRY